MTLTDADLARLEALDKAATEGPWHRVYSDAQHADHIRAADRSWVTQFAASPADAELIAEFRNRTPDLVAELREALAALARVKALCEQAVAEYQPHDVTPWVAVHELRAALAGES